MLSGDVLAICSCNCSSLPLCSDEILWSRIMSGQSRWLPAPPASWPCPNHGELTEIKSKGKRSTCVRTQLSQWRTKEFVRIYDGGTSCTLRAVSYAPTPGKSSTNCRLSNNGIMLRQTNLLTDDPKHDIGRTRGVFRTSLVDSPLDLGVPA